MPYMHTRALCDCPTMIDATGSSANIAAEGRYTAFASTTLNASANAS